MCESQGNRAMGVRTALIILGEAPLTLGALSSVIDAIDNMTSSMTIYNMTSSMINYYDKRNTEKIIMLSQQKFLTKKRQYEIDHDYLW